MEDLSAHGIQSGYFFGPGSPINWGKDLPAILAKVPAPQPTVFEVAKRTFLQAARLHGRYWQDRSVFAQYDWLRGHDWLQRPGSRYLGESTRAR